MTDINKALKAILVNTPVTFVTTKETADGWVTKKPVIADIDQAIAKIKALVVDSLPKERKEGFDDKNWSEQYGEMGGWNDCLEEIRSIYQ